MKPVTHIKKFVEYLNDSTKFHPWSYDTLKEFLRDVEKVSKEFFTSSWQDPNEKQSRILRASTLGYPSVIQAMKVLGYDKRIPAEGTSNKLSRLFMDGHLFEAELVAHLKSFPRFNVHSQQKTVIFEGVEGHIDCVISTPTGDVLVEVKTMSPYYFDKFVRSPDDERGYITQLGVYTEALNLEGVWVAKNKATSEVAVVVPDVEDLEMARHRAHLLVPMLKRIEKFDDIFQVFQAPEPVEEVCRKIKTGRLLIPPEMRYSPWRYVFYNIEMSRNCYSKPTEYVKERSSLEEARNRMTALGYEV
jgi:hypothetical protein